MLVHGPQHRLDLRALAVGLCCGHSILHAGLEAPAVGGSGSRSLHKPQVVCERAVSGDFVDPVTSCRLRGTQHKGQLVV